jgi:trehalose-phosphatase
MSVSCWVKRAAAEHRAGRPVALFFDYDGTLTPIVSHPSLALLAPETRGLLADLAATDRVSVAVVSSRALGSLKELVAVPDLWYAGSGGMHMDFGDEELIDPSIAAFHEVADAIIVATTQLFQWYPGAWFDRKPGCLAVHYRALTPLMAACLVDEFRDALDELQIDCPPLRVREVTRSLEIALAGSWTKGTAVERTLARLPADAFAVYAGDGANDAEAVAAANARDGLSVGIGPEAPPAAGVRIDTQAEFVKDLADLAAEIAPGRSAGPPAWTPACLHGALDPDLIPTRWP